MSTDKSRSALKRSFHFPLVVALLNACIACLSTQEIIRDVKELQPSGWVYWQPVEPDVHDFGWGLINANYVDTHDRPSSRQTAFVRVNRTFLVFGQFTRYVRPGSHLIEIADPNSIAVYKSSLRRLTIIKVTGDASESAVFDLSNLPSIADTVQVTATTTAPGRRMPDWKQRNQLLQVSKHDGRKLIETNLYPKSVYTFVVQGVLR